MLNQTLYIPELVRISSIRKETALVKTFRLKTNKAFKPGQFCQVSVMGIGEAPISISSSSPDKGFLDLTVRRAGKLTQAVHKLNKDDFIGIRGPFGSSFPVDDAAGKDIIFAAGGIGLAPVRSAIEYVLRHRKRYGRLYLLYGARARAEMIFKHDLKKWQAAKNFKALLTIDKPERSWNGNVGVVTALFDRIKLIPGNSAAFVCGPPIMLRYAVFKLIQLGFDDKNIFASLERYMKCGVGKCGHCYIGDKYACTDGPVFSLEGLKKIKADSNIQ